jgi:hypothetical protein
MCYFKVFRDNDGDLQSGFVKDPISITYPLGEWTSAPIGKVFIFGDLASAEIYANDMLTVDWRTVVYYVEAEGVEPISHIIRGSQSAIELDLRKFWEDDYFAWCHPPEGTLVADRIKPIGEVY